MGNVFTKLSMYMIYLLLEMMLLKFPPKKHLFTHCQTKDRGSLKYFLGMKIAQSKEGIFI